jgi:hypothetical protein
MIPEKTEPHVDIEARVRRTAANERFKRCRDDLELAWYRACRDGISIYNITDPIWALTDGLLSQMCYMAYDIKILKEEVAKLKNKRIS